MTTPKSDKPFRREIELDFVRGIAILLVLDFHDGKYGLLNYPLRLLYIPHPGWMGVDVFFVLSGFLVGGLLVKEWKVRGRVASKRFLIRRGFKIWPQYYVFLFLQLAVGHRTLRQLWGNLLNIQNYVGGIAHTWSLAVEEHAYLLIVFFLALAARYKLGMRHLFFLFAGMCVLIDLLRLFLISKDFDVYNPTHTRVSAIFYGVMLAMLYHYAPETFSRLQGLRVLWCGILLATLAYMPFEYRHWWGPELTYDFADFSGISLLMLLYHHREGITRAWPYRVVAWIGVYSYGIYLWHVAFAAPIFALSRHLPAWLVPAWQGVIPIAVAIFIGFITTTLVELPALKLRDRWFPRRVDSPVGIPAEFELQ